MSDWIEKDGKKYFEEGYLILANNNAARRGRKIKELTYEVKQKQQIIDTLHETCRHYEQRLSQQQTLLDKYAELYADTVVLANGELLPEDESCID